MPKYEITSPDGKRFEVTAPDGATQEQVLEYAQKNFGAAPVAKAPEPLTEGESIASSVPARFLAGVASPATVLMKMVGPDSIKQQIAKIDAMRQRGMEKRDTGFDFAGLAGSMVPGAGIAAGVGKALPAATTLLGKMGQGALTGGLTAAAQPLPGQDELSMDKLKQVGTGAAVGGVIPAVTQGVKSFFGTNRLNPTQQATLKEGQAAGYGVPPSTVNPSGLNNVMESIAGKAAIGQEAAARNQLVTNRVAAKELGLPADTPLTESVLMRVRDQAAEPYRKIADLSSKAKDALEKLKQARFDAKEQWNFYFKSGNPEAGNKARALDVQIAAFEKTIDDEAKKIVEVYGVSGSPAARSATRQQLSTRALSTGKEAGATAETLEASKIGERTAGEPNLLDQLRDARTKIAKAWDIEKSLNLGDSNISAPIVGRQLDKSGVAGKSGGLATIGKMAEAFPSVMREGAKVPVAGVSGTDAAASAILGTLGYGAAGPSGLVAAAMPLMRPIARNAALSPTYQKYLAQGIPARYIPIIDAMTQQATGAAGTTVGRNY